MKHKSDFVNAAIFYSDYVQWPFDYYYRGNLDEFGIDESVTDAAEIAGLVDTATLGKERFWLILSHCDFPEPKEAYLRYKYGDDSVIMEREFVGIWVLLFDLSSRE
jgi:hypothetical protein